MQRIHNILRRAKFQDTVWGRAWRSLAIWGSRDSNAASRATLGACGHPAALKLERALERFERGDGRFVEIESARAALLADFSPLSDGTLGPAGIADGNLTVAAACRASKPPAPAAFLHHVVREFAPRSAIELGTNVGISSAYIATALPEEARLVTLESSPYRSRIARQVHARLGLDNVEYVLGLFSETVDTAMSILPSVDFAFIDGHHQYQPTLDYFQRLAARARGGAVFVFDDIRWSPGMKRAWDALQNERRFDLVVDLWNVGICILGHDADVRTVVPSMRLW